MNCRVWFLCHGHERSLWASGEDPASYLPDVILGGPRRADLWESKPYDDGRYGVLEFYE